MAAQSSLTDYVIAADTPPPANYPFEGITDSYSTTPFQPTYDARRKAWLEFILRNPAPTTPEAPFFELARLTAGGTPYEGIFRAALDYIDNRLDGGDHPLHCMLRLVYQFAEHPRLTPDLIRRTRVSLLDFKYWPDEPGVDHMCTWTESHYILFTSAAYLAGQLYPTEIFENSSQTGEQMMATHRLRILRWMNLRFFTGFSEWLSNVYYDEDLTALLSLVDFCEDEDIRTRATILVDLILLDMALNNFKGVFASTHGRSYENCLKWAEQEPTSPTQKLLFGSGVFSAQDNMSAVAFALSTGYRMPQVLFEIANDQERAEMVNLQRIGLLMERASWWNLNAKNFEDGMLFLNMGAAMHPRTANLFVRMLDAFSWWNNPAFEPYHKHRRRIRSLKMTGLLPFAVSRVAKDVNRGLLEEVNTYTYRTPDYILNSAQDYHKGWGGDQQHIWQATLGPGVVCFTTHPARLAGPPPSYWTGSGSLPRVAQIKNVVIVIYRVESNPAWILHDQLPFTHAWLPRDQFDEVTEHDGWIFARCADGYLALRSQHPYIWQPHPGEDQDREIIVRGHRNTWLCELGRAQTHGDFSSFVDNIRQAKLRFSGSKVLYYSPSQGRLEFGWNSPLLQDGRPVPLDEYPRYQNPYVQAPFPPEEISVSLGEHSLNLNWVNGTRGFNTSV